MFAGAAREAVFSKPEVIRRLNAEFVPVALKAFLVNNPTDDEEGRLYREIGRSKPAPQGICVANSAGKVLAWALMFDDQRSVLDFLDHTQKRYCEFPDAANLVAAQRFMKFPSRRLADVTDTGEVPLVSERHPQGKRCPASPRFRRGTVVARVYGRALDAKGQPVKDTRSQESYVEDRFSVPVEMQEELASALSLNSDRAKLPNKLARLFVTHAHLGQIDVRPLSSPVPGCTSDLRYCEFWARRIGPERIRIEGRSAVVAEVPARRGDGASFEHAVKLDWDGLIDLPGNRITRLLLSARGFERLRWTSGGFKGESDVTRLPAGRPINQACDVRYGILGEPCAESEARARDF